MKSLGRGEVVQISSTIKERREDCVLGFCIALELQQIK